MRQCSVMIARFPFGNSDCPDVSDWITDSVLKAKKDPRISEILRVRQDDTPITMSRNFVMRQAKQYKADILVMVDNDMKPDAYLGTNTWKLAADPRAKPFWDTALNFMLEHNGPCLIGAPYCGPPPLESAFIFQWKSRESDHPGPDHKLEMVERERAARSAGWEQVAALPTGLIMIDMRITQLIKPPYFYYEWTDPEQWQKASTEDVTFTRDCTLAGIPCYVNWDCWAGHWKRKCVGRPNVLTQDHIRGVYRQAMETPSMNYKLIDLRLNDEPLARPVGELPPALQPGAEFGAKEKATVVAAQPERSTNAVGDASDHDDAEAADEEKMAAYEKLS